MIRACYSEQKGYFNDISKFLWVLDCIEISCGRCGANLKSETSPAQSWMYMRTTFKLTTTKWAVKFCQSRQRLYWNDNLLWEIIYEDDLDGAADDGDEFSRIPIWSKTSSRSHLNKFRLETVVNLICKVSTTAEWWWWWKQLSIINDYDDDDSYKKTLSKNMKTSQELRKLPVTSYRESQI